MSTLLYGNLTRKRLAMKPAQGLAAQPQLTYAVRRQTGGRFQLEPLAVDDSDAPADTGTIPKALDVATALVPAEVLAIHAAVLGLVGNDVGEHKQALQLTFWVLAALPAVLYFVGQGRASLDPRALVPCLAFVVWTVLGSSAALDAVIGDVDPATALLVGLVGALVLGGGSFGGALKAQTAAP